MSIIDPQPCPPEPGGDPSLFLLRGDSGDRPDAGDVAPGTLYYSVDLQTTDQSDGDSWETYNDVSAAGGLPGGATEGEVIGWFSGAVTWVRSIFEDDGSGGVASVSVGGGSAVLSSTDGTDTSELNVEPTGGGLLTVLGDGRTYAFGVQAGQLSGSAQDGVETSYFVIDPTFAQFTSEDGAAADGSFFNISPAVVHVESTDGANTSSYEVLPAGTAFSDDVTAGESTQNGTDGVILYSPDGTAWRVTVNNAGSLVTATV